jgi:BioD-like phosphotransacetylase family protein
MSDEELIETEEVAEEAPEAEEVVVEEAPVAEAPKRKSRAKKEVEPEPEVDPEVAEVNAILSELFSDVDVWWDKTRTQLGGRSAREAWEAGDTDAVWKMVR